jgi:hypothetical protein
MKDSFNRPTPYTLRGIRIKRATKQTLFAEVALQDSGGRNRPSQYLKPQIEGGPRNLKGYEKQIGRGYPLRLTKPFTAPGKDYPRDPYGNIPGGIITRTLSDIGILRGRPGTRTHYESSKAVERLAARRTKRGASGKPVCFLRAPGGGRYPMGIWERRRIIKDEKVFWTIRPVFIFVNSTNYEPRLEWDFTARLIFERNFHVNFQQALAYALATARKG